jgi:RNA polymerase sigma-70 factor (ECF subfamily)
MSGPETKGTTGGFDLCELAIRHGSLLYARARKLTGNSDAAWDLLQDVYEKALKSPPPEVRPERSLAWLLVVMKNLYLDKAAAQRRRPHISLAIVPELPAAEPEGEPEWASHSMAEVREGLRSLAPCLSVTFEMNAFEGCSYAEISRRLRIPVHTVGSRVFRAKAHLRKRLCRRHDPNWQIERASAA